MGVIFRLGVLQYKKQFIEVKKSLFHRFLSKKLSHEELHELRHEVNHDPEVFLHLIEDDWLHFRPEGSPEWSDRHWKKLESMMDGRKAKQTKVFRLSWASRVAAAILIVISAWFALSPSGEVATGGNGEPAIITHVNDTEHASTIVLKDGTKVILNPNSTLSYYENYNSRYRVVHLEGEAFFETNENIERPFIVISGNITSICRGDKFTVSAFKDSEEISVSLASGSIDIAQNDRLNSEYNKVSVGSCQIFSFNKVNHEYSIGEISDCDFNKKEQNIKKASRSNVVML